MWKEVVKINIASQMGTRGLSERELQLNFKSRDTIYDRVGVTRKKERTCEWKQAVKIGRSNRMDELSLPVLPPDFLLLRPSICGEVVVALGPVSKHKSRKTLDDQFYDFQESIHVQ